MAGYLGLNQNGEYVLDFSSLISGEKKTLPFSIEIDFLSPDVKNGNDNYEKDFEKDVLSCIGKFEGKVEDKNEEFLLSFTANAKLKVLCSRCAEEMNYFVDKEFSSPLCGKKPNRGTEEYELFKKGKINLSEIFREFLILELPSQFFCRKVCAGLCAKCGANLNRGVCECDNQELDSRLRPLADFLKKLTEEEDDDE